ncbi:hypothetical protein QZH41_007802 [Actinostola sp. cb2023]|nr:hypothetical protein QZH41_007802 [Actinostola sp. cb2023]
MSTSSDSEAESSSSSDLLGNQDFAGQGQIQPYQFEPELSTTDGEDENMEEEATEEEEEEEEDQRTDNLDWCLRTELGMTKNVISQVPLESTSAENIHLQNEFLDIISRTDPSTLHFFDESSVIVTTVLGHMVLFNAEPEANDLLSEIVDMIVAKKGAKNAVEEIISNEKKKDFPLFLTKGQVKAVRRMIFSIVKQSLGIDKLVECDIPGAQVNLRPVVEWMLREIRLHRADTDSIEVNLKLDGRPFWGRSQVMIGLVPIGVPFYKEQSAKTVFPLVIANCEENRENIVAIIRKLNKEKNDIKKNGIDVDDKHYSIDFTEGVGQFLFDRIEFWKSMKSEITDKLIIYDAKDEKLPDLINYGINMKKKFITMCKEWGYVLRHLFGNQLGTGDYGHLTIEHASMLMRRFGSMRNYSGQGFEASHKLHRQLYAKATNHDLKEPGDSESLAHIHINGYLHCDLKANNIVLEEKEGEYSPIIIDFGKSIKIEDATFPLPKPRYHEYRQHFPHIARELVTATCSLKVLV